MTGSTTARVPRARAARRILEGAALAWLVTLALVGAGTARGAVFPDLYTLTVTPDPQAVDTRQAAIDLAMRRLLVRITGERDPDSDPALRTLIEDASRYVASVALGIDRER
ncbi:MAG: DUF2066 domain-containing protein, partial [Gammaproteobacteria bacterium]